MNGAGDMEQTGNSSLRGVFRFFAGLIERIGDRRLRVYLYHFPQMTGVGFGLPLSDLL